MTVHTFRRFGTLLAAFALVLAACGSDDGDTETGAQVSEDAPTIVVTTNILGDVVTELVGDQANVVTIMPVGADPHDFQPSAQEVDQILSADALITNGTNFEEGLLDVIDSASDEGVPTFEATSAVETIEFGGGGHDDHGHGDDHDDHEDEEGHKDDEDGHDHDEEEGHDDEEGHDHDEDEEHKDDEEGHDDHGDDEHGHAHDGDDPHFFTDPVRMTDVVAGISAFLSAEVDGLDTAALDTAAADYTAELEALDAEVRSLVEDIPADSRILVTNHEVFGYFADQYGFEVVGAVIPSGSTVDGASAGDLAELAETIEEEGVKAIFSDASSSDNLIEALAAEVGDVEVVELYTESLGESGSDGGTYLDMVRTNATRISAALG
ncbi:MAG: metal ABC transporter substrate-binding protein [Actinomycetota bacterium]